MDEDQGRKYAEVDLVAGRGLWRFRASPEHRDEEQPSQCGGDYFALGDDAGFSLTVVHRGAGEPRMPVTEIEWSFWGLPEHLDLPRVKTSNRDDEQGRHPERRAFVEALVAAIDSRGPNREPERPPKSVANGLTAASRDMHGRRRHERLVCAPSSFAHSRSPCKWVLPMLICSSFAAKNSSAQSSFGQVARRIVGLLSGDRCACFGLRPRPPCLKSRREVAGG